jgi:hypothetical protein
VQHVVQTLQPLGRQGDVSMTTLPTHRLSSVVDHRIIVTLLVLCFPAGSISSKLLQAHLNYLHTHSAGIKGVDGRCLANLTWALAKLDLSSDDNALTTELALMVAPFIIRTLDTSSPQVGLRLCACRSLHAQLTCDSGEWAAGMGARSVLSMLRRPDVLRGVWQPACVVSF